MLSSFHAQMPSGAQTRSRARHPLRRALSGLLALVFALTPLLAAADWTPPAANSTWLQAVNYYRAYAGLQAITEDTQMSFDCAKHANYIVQTATLTHSESQAQFPQYFTTEGDTAAKQSNLNGGPSDTAGTQLGSVDGWVNTVFHGLPLISPRLLTSGYGEAFGMSATAGVNWTGACINTQRGDSGLDPTAPVYWPPKDKTTPFLDYHGGEMPNPLCGGYATPTGPFVMLQVPDILGNAPASSGSIKLGNQTLESCVYDTKSFTVRPGDEGFADVAKGILNKYNAVILVPKLPFTPGNTYTVTMNANGKDYTWSFDSGPAPKQTVTVTATSVGRNINVPNPTLFYTISGQIPGDTEDTIFTTKPTCTTAATQASPAGQYDITCAGGVSTNYNIAYVKGTLTVTDPAATFALTTSAVGTGTVSPAGTTQQAGVVNVTATPGTGQTFIGWKVNGVAKGWANPLKVTMTATMAVEATFVATPSFGDVGAGAAADPIQQLAARGVINGCDKDALPPLFCPDAPTLRHQMAALIVRAIPGWIDETGLPTFGDNTSDTELMTRVATLQRHNVVRGYQADVCQERKIATPPGCYGPTDQVKYGQVMLFIARAMVEKGYWTLQPDDRTIFPDQNGAAGAPADDQQTKDHQMVVTYVHYVVTVPDVANVHANFVLTNGQGWGDSAPRAWFTRAFWPALQSYFGVNP